MTDDEAEAALAARKRTKRPLGERAMRLLFDVVDDWRVPVMLRVRAAAVVLDATEPLTPST